MQRFVLATSRAVRFLPTTRAVSRPFGRVVGIAVVALGLALAPGWVGAQIAHLPPHYSPPIADGDSLIRITRVADDTTVLRVAVSGSTLRVVHGRKPEDVIPFGDRSVSELRDFMVAKYPEWDVQLVGHPQLHSKYIGDLALTEVGENTVYLRTSYRGSPVVTASIGLLYSLVDVGSAASTSSLLGSSGFQLDLGGTFLLCCERSEDGSGGDIAARSSSAEPEIPEDVGGGDTSNPDPDQSPGDDEDEEEQTPPDPDEATDDEEEAPPNPETPSGTDAAAGASSNDTSGDGGGGDGWLLGHDALALRVRTGFVADEAIPQGSPGQAASVSDALILADQLALGLQLDFVWGTSPSQFMWTVEGGYVFSDPGPFDFGAVDRIVPDSTELRSSLDGVEGLRYVGTTIGAQFNRGDDYLFYVALGLGWNERLERGVGQRVDESPVVVIPPPLIDFPSVSGKERLEILFRAGFRWGGVLDLRVDALDPLTDREFSEPIVRVVVARPFQLIG